MIRRLAVVAALVLAAEPAAAQIALPRGVEGVALLEGWRQADGRHIAAIEIRLAPGWHTYWRLPGATGIPPQFDWTASRNLGAVAYEWPRPAVLESAGAVTIGYEGALVLPVVLTPDVAGAPVEVALELFFGVCDEICVPAQARLTGHLTATAAPAGRARIEAALAARPLDARDGGVASARCALAPSADGDALTAEITFDTPPDPGLVAVLETARPDVWIGAARTRTDGRRLLATAPVEHSGGGGVVLDRAGLRLTVLGAETAIDIRGCPG